MHVAAPALIAREAPFLRVKPRAVPLEQHPVVKRSLVQCRASIVGGPTVGHSPHLKEDLSLRSWITSHGGTVWSSLRLVEKAPCGCRGIITTAPVPLDLAQTMPLILIPERLYMTTNDARQLLKPLEAKRFSLPFWRDEPPAVAQLAVLLALERQRGNDSFWAPYICSLPTFAPCAWALNDTELRAQLAHLGPRAEGWERTVQAAQRRVHQIAEHAVQRYGKHLPGKLSVEDVIWAMGQVRRWTV